MTRYSTEIPAGWRYAPSCDPTIAFEPCGHCETTGRICHARCLACEGYGFLSRDVIPVPCDVCGRAVCPAGVAGRCVGCCDMAFDLAQDEREAREAVEA